MASLGGHGQQGEERDRQRDWQGGGGQGGAEGHGVPGARDASIGAAAPQHTATPTPHPRDIVGGRVAV